MENIFEEANSKFKKTLYMLGEKDICLKDEGDFTTVIFMTDKAQKILREQMESENGSDLKEQVYGDKVLKIDIANESVRNIIGWAVTHRLTIENS